jgi:hypothetical protein
MVVNQQVLLNGVLVFNTWSTVITCWSSALHSGFQFSIEKLTKLPEQLHSWDFKLFEGKLIYIIISDQRLRIVKVITVLYKLTEQVLH